MMQDLLVWLLAIIIFLGLIIIAVYQCLQLFKLIKSLPFAFLVAFLLLIPFAFSLLSLHFYGELNLFKYFQDIVGILLVTFFYKEIVLGTFKLTELSYFDRKNLQDDDKKEKKKDFNRLESVIKLMMSASYISVYISIQIFTNISSFLNEIVDPVHRLLVIEAIVVACMAIFISVCFKSIVKTMDSEW